MDKVIFEIMNDDIYLSIDEARDELRRRWHDLELRRAIETELGHCFIDLFKKGPRGCYWPPLASPTRAFEWFVHLARYVGSEPTALECSGDYFSRGNDEKVGLSRLRVTNSEQQPCLVDCLSLHAANRKEIRSLTTRMGIPLVELHRILLRESELAIECQDISDWTANIGKAAAYYDPFFSHFIAHGVLFETYDLDTEYESKFTKEVVLPAFNNVKSRYGLSPMIVNLYPSNQTQQEDFYWWSYGPRLSRYILALAQQHNLPIRPALTKSAE
jgi:hypothetical protein